MGWKHSASSIGHCSQRRSFPHTAAGTQHSTSRVLRSCLHQLPEPQDPGLHQNMDEKKIISSALQKAGAQSHFIISSYNEKTLGTEKPRSKSTVLTTPFHVEWK